MKDDDIPVKQLSDWKPETDIKLVKAFGKFIEEAGELVEAIIDFKQDSSSFRSSLEEELADCDAMMSLIEMASDDRIRLSLDTSPLDPNSPPILRLIGSAVSIVGRCQQQGLMGTDPEKNTLNVVTLTNCFNALRRKILTVSIACNCDQDRICKRTAAKIEFKLPWVMGTAKDLLPST